MNRERSAVHLTVIAVAALAAFCGVVAAARHGDQDAEGEISEVEATLTRIRIWNPILKHDVPARKITIRVEGTVSSGYLWLACTVTWLDEEYDLPVKTVKSKRDGKEKEFTAKFSRLLVGVVEEDGEWKEVPDNEPAYYSVALWRWKVYKKDCKNGEEDGPCEYCKKNGYHMEDRIDRESGIATLPTESL